MISSAAVPVPDALVVPFTLILGAFVGSFLNVVIYRVPRNAFLAAARSHCPHCLALIHWYDNLPVLSWLLLRGRCRSCLAPISPRYALVEALTAALFLVVVRRFGVEWQTLVWLAFVAALVAVTFIDVDWFIIPNEISLGGALAGLAISLVMRAPGGAADPFFPPHGRLATFVRWIPPTLPPGFRGSLAGLLVGGGLLWAGASLYQTIAGREGMGMGDVKLLAMIGAFLGFWSIPFTVIVAAFAGSVVGVVGMLFAGKGRKSPIPFGPFLSLGALAYLLVGSVVMQVWLLGAGVRLPPEIGG